jgi:hypothetical protein
MRVKGLLDESATMQCMNLHISTNCVRQREPHAACASTIGVVAPSKAVTLGQALVGAWGVCTCYQQATGIFL